MSAQPVVIRQRYRARPASLPAAMSLYFALPFAAAALLALGLRSAFLYRPSGVSGLRPDGADAAYVRLAPAARRAALRRVRTAWQVDRGALESPELDPAEYAFGAALRPREPATRARPAAAPLARGPAFPPAAAHPLLPPSVAAPPPAELKEETGPDAAEELFPRAGLLEFDGLKPLRKGTRK